MALETFEMRYPKITGLLRGSLFFLEKQRRKEQQEAWMAVRDYDPGPDPSGDADEEITVAVQARQGRLLVICPACSSAEPASEGEPWFFCCMCRNEATSPPHLRVKEAWPSGTFRENLERILAARPQRIMQDWLPGETIEDLVAENLQNGWPVPELV